MTGYWPGLANEVAQLHLGLKPNIGTSTKIVPKYY